MVSINRQESLTSDDADGVVVEGNFPETVSCPFVGLHSRGDEAVRGSRGNESGGESSDVTH